MIDPLIMTSCLGKTPFESRSDAAKALREIRSAGRLKHSGADKGARGKIEIYYCVFCERYHHGHQRTQSMVKLRQRGLC